MILTLGLLGTPCLTNGQEFDRTPGNPADTMEQDSANLGQEIDESEWVFPNFGWQKSQRPDQVFLAFPQENANFPMGSVITLGWQPVLEPSLDISHYEIVVRSAVTPRDTIARTGLVDEGTVNTYLFRPKTPGEYFWTVRAVTKDGMTIPAVGRSLNIFE